MSVAENDSNTFGSPLSCGEKKKKDRKRERENNKDVRGENHTDHIL